MKINLTLKIIIAMIFLFLSSCIKKENMENSIDFSSKKYSESTLSDVISNYSIIKLETIDDSRINTIKKVLIEEQKIYILNHQENKQEILIFSTNGDYIDKISEINHEENEFYISDFDIHPMTNQIYLLSQKQKKVVVFDEKMEFIRSFNLNYPAKEIAFGTKSGRVFVVFRVAYQKEDIESNFEIVTYDENREFTNNFFPFEKGTPHIQDNAKTLIKRNDQVMFLKGGSNLIYSIELEKCSKTSNLIFSKPILPVDKTYAAFYTGEVDLTQYLYNVNYIESDTISFVTFSSVEGNYIGIYNKNSEVSSVYNPLLDPNCQCGVTIDIVGSIDNYFIVQIPRVKISSVMDVVDSSRTKANNEEMFKIIDNMEPGTNPILLLLEIKI
jgi:hypothetical protein